MDSKNIVYESGNYWVLKVPSGFEIYRTGVTHSVRCAQIGWKGKQGLTKAKAEIERRQHHDSL